MSPEISFILKGTLQVLPVREQYVSYTPLLYSSFILFSYRRATRGTRGKERDMRGIEEGCERVRRGIGEGYEAHERERD